MSLGNTPRGSFGCSLLLAKVQKKKCYCRVTLGALTNVWMQNIRKNIGCTETKFGQ
jgi:hypothetical protein